MEARFDPAGPSWAAPIVLEGERVRLEPLSIEHLEGLAEIAFDLTLWRWTTMRPRLAVGVAAAVFRTMHCTESFAFRNCRPVRRQD